MNSHDQILDILLKVLRNIHHVDYTYDYLSGRVTFHYSSWPKLQDNDSHTGSQMLYQ